VITTFFWPAVGVIALAALAAVIGILVALALHFLRAPDRSDRHADRRAGHASGRHTWPLSHHDLPGPDSQVRADASAPGWLGADLSSSHRPAGEIHHPLPGRELAVYHWAAVAVGDNRLQGNWPNDRASLREPPIRGDDQGWESGSRDLAMPAGDRSLESGSLSPRTASGTLASVTAGQAPADTTSWDDRQVALLTELLGGDPWDGRDNAGAYVDRLFAGIVSHAKVALA
jgi:hypothetical protein